MSLFSAVEMAPRDPILGLNEQYNADTNPNKVNLGVGVYFDDNGKLPLLQCVQAAEKTMMATPTARGYLPIDGIVAYDNAVKALVFGAESDVVKSGRVSTVQAIGGTGGLKIGADFLKKVSPNAKVLISDPSWENHRAIFVNAGFEVGSYAYYDAEKRGVNFDGMLASLNAALYGLLASMARDTIRKPKVQRIVNPQRWVDCKLWIDGEARRKCFAALFGDDAQFVERWPWTFWVDMVCRDRRNTTPVINSCVEQYAKVVT